MAPDFDNLKLDTYYDLLNRFPELSGALAERFDEESIIPEAEERVYKFSSLSAQFYDYPSSISNYICAGAKEIKCVTVAMFAIQDGNPELEITIELNDTEIKIKSDSLKEEHADFTMQLSSTPERTYPIPWGQMGDMLVSIALSAAGSSKVDEARLAGESTAKLNPNDPRIIRLIENSLGYQADYWHRTRYFGFALDENKPLYEDGASLTDVDFIHTALNDGNKIYEVRSRGNEVSGGEIKTFSTAVSMETAVGKQSKDKPTIDGVQTVSSIDGEKSTEIDAPSIVAYTIGILESALRKYPQKIIKQSI